MNKKDTDTDTESKVTSSIYSCLDYKTEVYKCCKPKKLGTTVSQDNHNAAGVMFAHIILVHIKFCLSSISKCQQITLSKYVTNNTQNKS